VARNNGRRSFGDSHVQCPIESVIIISVIEGEGHSMGLYMIGKC